MIEIARNYKIEYEPDPTMFLVSKCSILCNMLQYYSIQDDDGIPAASSDLINEPFLTEAEPLPSKDESSIRSNPYVINSESTPQAPPINRGVSSTTSEIKTRATNVLSVL